MAHHNRTPQTVLTAPSRTVETTTPPTQQVTVGKGDDQRWYTGRRAVRAIQQAKRSEQRQTERSASRLARFEARHETWTPPAIDWYREDLLTIRRAARKAKQAEFRARQAASVWPDGNRRTLSKSARANRS